METHLKQALVRIERLRTALEHYANPEIWGEARDANGNRTGFADWYLGFQQGADGDNGYDKADAALTADKGGA